MVSKSFCREKNVLRNSPSVLLKLFKGLEICSPSFNIYHAARKTLKERLKSEYSVNKLGSAQSVNQEKLSTIQVKKNTEVLYDVFFHAYQV